MLNFVSMHTECAYDYLFIYDGDSYSSPLLGTFSGKTTPDRVLARSGKVSTITQYWLSYWLLAIILA